MSARWPGHFAERACHADAYTARRTAPDSDREFAPFSSPYATAPLPALEHRTFDRPAVSHDPSNAASRDPVPERPAPSLPVLRVLGQVAGTYIIAEGPEGLYMIDQHAAHERVVYERFLGQISAAGVERQPMLDPLVFDLSPEESAVVEQSLDELGQLGFELERFGPSSLIIRSVPAVAVGTDVQARLRAILRELGEGGAGSSRLDSVAVSVAVTHQFGPDKRSTFRRCGNWSSSSNAPSNRGPAAMAVRRCFGSRRTSWNASSAAPDRSYEIRMNTRG